MRQTPVEQWLEEQNTNSDIEQYAHETWYVTNLFHLSAPPVDPAYVADMAWLWSPNDVMRGMPRAGLWSKLPYKAQPMFLLPNPLWASLGIESQHALRINGHRSLPWPCQCSWTRLCYLGLQDLISEIISLESHLPLFCVFMSHRNELTCLTAPSVSPHYHHPHIWSCQNRLGYPTDNASLPASDRVNVHLLGRRILEEIVGFLF